MKHYLWRYHLGCINCGVNYNFNHSYKQTEFIAFTSQHCLYWGICKVLHFSFHGRYAWFSNYKRSLEIPTRFIFKAIIWGIIGVMITLVFTVFFQGAEGAMVKGLLPWKGSRLALAFWEPNYKYYFWTDDVCVS